MPPLIFFSFRPFSIFCLHYHYRQLANYVNPVLNSAWENDIISYYNLNFKNMKPKKIIAWTLIILGLIVVFWALYSSYGIFTAKKPVPEVFKLEESASEKNLADGTEEEKMEEMVREEIRNIVPSEAVYQLLNLLTWAFLAGLLIFGGGRISGIGISLLKK